MNQNVLETSSIVTAETSDTWETSSSASTVWGPGTLSGRAIKSLGEASLRGLEKLAVRWRLAKIKSDLPSPGRDRHGDTHYAPIPNEKLERMMDDLLELSRLDYYDSKVRQKALRLIMMQIGSRETGQLMGCIIKWPREEIMIFLSEMMPCMPLLWHDPSSSNSINLDGNANFTLKARLELISVYRSSQSPKETHEAIPFIDFISQLAQSNADARRAVLDAGFLDFLVVVHKHCFVPLDDSESMGYSEVVEVAKDALGAFLGGWKRDADLDELRVCKALQMELVWPRGREAEILPLSRHSIRLAQMTPLRRAVAWKAVSQNPQQNSRSTSPSLVFDRLCEISVILSIKMYHRAEFSKDLFDVCFDLLVFCDLESEDRDIADLALFHLLDCVALGGEPVNALRDVLVLSSYNTNLDFFYRIIYPLLRTKTQEILPTAQKFYNQVHHHHGPNKNPINHFIDFALDVAKRNQTCARAILDADIKSLLSTTGRPAPEVLVLFHELGSGWEENKRHPIQSRARAGTV